MSFLQREISRLNDAIRSTPSQESQHKELYAAQQALSWALEPTGFASPHDMIMGIRANSEDCQENIHPAAS
jgi:hypothetical protein